MFTSYIKSMSFWFSTPSTLFWVFKRRKIRIRVSTFENPKITLKLITASNSKRMRFVVFPVQVTRVFDSDVRGLTGLIPGPFPTLPWPPPNVHT